MSARLAVVTAAALSAALALEAGAAFAAVDSFALSGPANGAFVNATPTLTWGASTGATSYTLTVTPTTGAPLVISGLTSTSYSIAASDALSEAGSPYTWRVTARDDGGNSLDSNSWSFFVDTTPPSEFALTAPASGAFVRSSNAGLAWEAATDSGSGISKYHLFIDGVLCGDTPSPFDFPRTCSLTEGTHTWAVSVEDVAGNVRWCNDAPEGSGGRTIRVDNTAPGSQNPGTAYQVASGSTAGGLYTQYDFMVNTGINVAPGETITVTATGTWCYISCDVGCGGPSGSSSLGTSDLATQNCTGGSLIARIGGNKFHCLGSGTWTFTVGNDESGLLELGNNGPGTCTEKTVTATVIGGRLFDLVSPAPDAIVGEPSPTFSWQPAPDDGSGGVTYVLYIDNAVIGSAGVGTPISTTSFTVPSRLADGTHTWRVRARDAVGNSTDSTTRTFKIDTTRPDPFRLRTPATGSCSTTPTPSLCWNSPTDAGGLGQFELWVDGALATSVDARADCATPDVALKAGTHTWYAVAIDRVGHTRQSTDQFSVLIDYTAPAAPMLTAPADGGSSPDPPVFTWQAADDAGGIANYEVYVDDTLAATLGGDTLSWLPPTDLAQGSHSWYVRAIDHCGQSATSAPRSFTTVACTPDGAPHPCPGYNVGRCQPGTRTCTSPGTWSACTGAVKPSIELCNGEDDDCDGIVDNGNILNDIDNQCGGVCRLFDDHYAPCDGPDTDRCAEGVMLCTGLNSMTCVETVPPEVEICNGLDDDCNGVVDDGCAAPPAPDGGALPDGAMPPNDAALPDGGGGAGGKSDAGSELDASVVSDAGTGGGTDGARDAGGRSGDGAVGTGASGGGEAGELGTGGRATEAGAARDGDTAATSAGSTGGDQGSAGASEGGAGATTNGADAESVTGGAADAGIGAGSSAGGCSCMVMRPASERPSEWMLLWGLALVSRRRKRGRR